MKLRQNLLNTNLLYTEKRNLNRDVRIINYFCIVAIISNLLLIIIRCILVFSKEDINIDLSENMDFVFASFVVTLPMICTRYGKIDLARLLVSWLPPLLITSLYSMHALRQGGVLTIAEFNSLYLFLLSTTAVPYLLGSSGKYSFFARLLLPMLFIVFCDIILRFFGIKWAIGPSPIDDVAIYRMRAFIACFLLNGCCLGIKKIIDKQDAINDSLIEKLEEQNILTSNMATVKITETQSRYRQLFEQAEDAIMLLNQKKEIEKVNPSACKMFDYSVKEFLNMELNDVRNIHHGKNILQDTFLLDNSGTAPVETTFIRKNGSIFPAEVNGKKLPDGSYQLFIRDITFRKKAQQVIKEAEEKFRALVERSVAGVFIIQNKKFSYINPQFTKIFDYTYEEIDGKPISILNAPENMYTAYKESARSVVSKEYICLERVARKKNGELINVEVLGCMTIINDKPAIIGTLIDTTEKRRLQKRIAEQKELEQKKIMRAMLRAEEKERERLGRELHDNISQILASALLYISLAADDKTDTKKHIENSKDIVVSAIEEIRGLSHRLVVPNKQSKLDDLIRGLAEKIKLAAPLEFNICYCSGEHEIRDDIKLNVYRIIQEQMNNILKHAKANSITIEVKVENNFLHVSIADDGKGFNPDSQASGIGLANIANRVESFNGRLQIKSSPGYGCALIMQIPLKQNVLSSTQYVRRDSQSRKFLPNNSF
ncbi:MAG: PAS domain S-box protein [Chitinophagaceae bacterium]